MKHPVKLSPYSILYSCIGIVLLGGLAWNALERDNMQRFWFFVVPIAILMVLSLFYSPIAISVDGESLKIHRSLKTKRIPMNEIETVYLVSPTIAEKRLLGAGGWFGHWGWMKEPLIGKYFAYYGRASDCFLVRLKDGRQYLLGCTDPATIVAYIKKHIGRDGYKMN